MLNENVKTYAVLKAIQYMQEHLDQDVTSEELALHVGYSPYHFSRVFKEATGVSPRHYLSALRIEAGKSILIQSSSTSILKALLSTGFRSLGTFSTTFKKYVGLSPKQFQGNTKKLHQFMNEFEREEQLANIQLTPPILTCHLDFPSTFKGLIFVGLFPRPIPDQKPVVGSAVKHHQRSCVFTNIPVGTYFILAAALPFSLHPKDYFLLDHSLRGKYKDSVEITENSDVEIEITLRNRIPTDPPILVNLPQLLLEKTKKRAN
ncbi:AraC family transcriptional regulator [Bacillus salitolerans]|uniref:AraC family transcriptional regulator n=1 Tax=Bacillus salitolerans TaxID=1437434 RepID=A0ABW4LUE6_9BACI